ncbi:hypothetical protein [Streptomyces djakartensis]|uniref:hypothetical protein n=1 Tax=Streptomyces djakartensis TaxID=68193 RepID=UPI0034DFB57C
MLIAWSSRSRQGRARCRMGAVNDRSDPATGAFPCSGPFPSTFTQESAMADLAFVLAVLAGFALVALVAKGVTRL